MGLAKSTILLGGDMNLLDTTLATPRVQLPSITGKRFL